jgi:hypothetical protein
MKRVALLLALVACSGPAPAQRSPTTTFVSQGAPLVTIDANAPELLDAWATAMGGRDALQELGALHAKGSYERGGLRGTIEVWVTPRGERREEI